MVGIPAYGRESESAQRARPALAFACDVATLLIALIAALLLATVWLLVRTEWGRIDASDTDALLTVVALSAVAPTWVAWQWLRLWNDQTTICGARLRVPSRRPMAPARAIIWLLLHPTSLPLWLWLTLSLLVAGVGLIALLPAALATLIALIGVGSAVVTLIRPRWGPLHDRVARVGTRARA